MFKWQKFKDEYHQAVQRNWVTDILRRDLKKGHYTVTFDTDFGEKPIVLATAIEDDGGARITTFASITPGKFEVYIKNAGGDYKNAAFNFSAWGPLD